MSLGFEAIITQVRGDVYIDGTKANKGDKLIKDQIIEAKTTKSFFVVEYSDGTRIMIKDGKFKMGVISTNNNEIELMSGTIYAKVKPSKNKKLKEFEKLIIKTRTASMGVRGTMFYITQEVDNSYLCVCEGIVETRNLKGESILVNENEDIKVFSSQELNKTNANQQMIDMGKEIFKTF